MQRILRPLVPLASAGLLTALVACAGGPSPAKIVDPNPETAATRLLVLMGERLALMPAVAQAKWNATLPVEDLPREQALVTAAVKAGAIRGLPAAEVERFFRAQIEAAKQVQRERFAEWRATGRGPFVQAPDLQHELRPRLDALTRSLLEALATTRNQRGTAEFRAAAIHLSPALLQSSGISERAAALALEPLRSP